MESRGDREVEAALVARSEGPRVLDEVARLTRLGLYRLLPRPTLLIRDSYFDTPAGDLGERKIALRLRESDDELLLTLKGEGQSGQGGVSRLELEAPWAEESLIRVLAGLREQCVAPVQVQDEVGRVLARAGDARSAVARLGFVVVQERETERRVRIIVAPADEERPLAELDIDSVTYRIGDRAARLHEVEIEAKEQGVELSDLVDSLLRQVPGLAPWRYSKLAIGKAIAGGLSEGRLVLEENGTIPPEAFDELAGSLGSG